MTTLPRILCLVLIVSTSGLAHAAEALFDGLDACADEASGESEQCTDECGLCFCCPLRAAPTGADSGTTSATTVEPVVAEPTLAAVAADLADIFQPPRA